MNPIWLLGSSYNPDPQADFEIAFDTDPLDPPIFTPLPDRLHSMSTRHGRNAPLTEYDGATWGGEVDNSDRAFDPLHTTGPYYGNIKPRRRVRQTKTYAGVVYTLFDGFLNGFAQQFNPPEVATSPLAAGDAFKILAGIELPASAYVHLIEGVSPSSWWRLDDLPKAARAHDMTGSTDGYVRFGASTGAGGLLPYETATSTEFTVGGKASIRFIPPAGLGPVHTVEAWIKATSQPEKFYPAQMIYEERDPNNFLNESIFITDGDGTGSSDYHVSSLVQVSPSFSQVESTVDVLDGELHHVVVVYSATVHLIYVDGVDVTNPVSSLPGLAVPSTASDASIGNDAGTLQANLNGQAQDVAVYRGTVLTAAQVAAHYAAGTGPLDGQTTGERVRWYLDLAGWPYDFADIDPGVETLGPARLDGGNVLAALQQVTWTELGELYVDHAAGGLVRFRQRYARLADPRSTTPQAVFTDDPAAAGPAYRFEPGDLTYLYDEDQVYNDITVTWVGGSERAVDQASIDSGTRQTFSVDTLLTSAAKAQTVAGWVLSKAKDPKVRFPVLTINPAADATLWLPALSLRVGDRVTVRHHPQQAGDPIVRDYWVEDIARAGGNGVNEFTATFILSEAEPLAYWVIGVSALGTDTRLAA